MKKNLKSNFVFFLYLFKKYRNEVGYRFCQYCKNWIEIAHNKTKCKGHSSIHRSFKYPTINKANLASMHKYSKTLITAHARTKKNLAIVIQTFLASSITALSLKSQFYQKPY